MLNLSRKAQRGFTLIELLVVISIIAMMLAILMPSLNRVKEQARIIVCASNVSQAGKAAYIYATDFEGHLPPFLGYEHSSSDTSPLIATDRRNVPVIDKQNIPQSGASRYVYRMSFGLLVSEPYGYSSASYLPDAESLICPGDKKAENHSWDDEVLNKGKKSFFGNVEMSYTYIYATPFDRDPKRESWRDALRYRIEKTSGEAVILSDSGYWGENQTMMASIPYKYHKEGMNVLHLDGRTHFIRGQALEEAFEAEETLPSASVNFWVNRLRVLDKM